MLSSNRDSEAIQSTKLTESPLSQLWERLEPRNYTPGVPHCLHFNLLISSLRVQRALCALKLRLPQGIISCMWLAALAEVQALLGLAL